MDQELSLEGNDQRAPQRSGVRSYRSGGSKRFPLLTDSRAEVLSFPPVINSDRIGAVEVGDENLFIELTGTDIYSLMLTANIVACDLSDAGCTILPVKIEYPYDTALGREVVCPFYFPRASQG
jgi:phenylalanyl-tRNA synthetase beta chain